MAELNYAQSTVKTEKEREMEGLMNKETASQRGREQLRI